MKADLGLQVAANAFIEALTPIVASLDTTAPRGDTGPARRRVTQEAFDLACSFIDADRRATDDELWSLIVAFAPTLDADLINQTPESLRARHVTDGTRARLAEPSALFADLLRNDLATGSSWSTTYYEHAVALGFMTASLDDYTDRAELVAIESFRSMLLAAIRTGRLAGDADTGEPTPGATGADGAAAAPAGNGPETGPGAPTSGPAAPGTGAGTPPAGTGAGGPSGPAATTAAAAPAGTTAADPPLPPPRPLDDLLAELDDLVGMTAVKDEIKLVTNLLRVQQIRRERGLKTLEQSHHLIFTGNPGTGKTTVARLVAQIYRTLGVVARGQLVETDRSGLVAGYVGQTATKVVEAFDRADEGVLLIDEAYALVRGSENDFGQEAIDTIVKLVEDRRDRVVVIAAGYPDEMDQFVASNPGLTSRFPKTIRFPDYTTEELLEIFGSLCDRANYLCDDDARAKVRGWIEAQPRVKGFGNARSVRNLFESIVSRQASRVVTIDEPTDIDLVMVLPPDVPEPQPLPASG